MKKRRPARKPPPIGKLPIGPGAAKPGPVTGGGGTRPVRKTAGKGRKKHAGSQRKHTGTRQHVRHRKVAKHHGGKVRKLASAGAGGPWITGGNDELASCAVAAVANSLLAATGWRVSDEDVLELYFSTASDPDEGATIAAAIAAAAEFGLGGWRPAAARPLAPGPGDWPGPYVLDQLTCGFTNRESAKRRPAGWPASLVLGLQLEEPHAAAVAPGGRLVTWGAAIPAAEWLPHVDEAWEIAWACCPGGR